MPSRPTISIYSKGDGTTSKMRSASPSWGGSPLNGTNSAAHVSSPRETLRSGSPANINTSSRRSAPLPSHVFGPPGGNRMKGAKEQQQHRSGGGFHGDRVSSPSGLGVKSKRLVHDAVDGGGGGLEGDNRAEDSGRIRVAVRVRPFSEKEKLAGTRCVISMSGNQTKILDPAYFDSEDSSSSPDDRSMWERTFSFDHSFWSHSSIDGNLFSSQANVHQALGEFLLDNACRGFNCSLFAYGQTGSGKTYTMLGDNSDLSSAAGEGTAGLIPRICVELFQRLGLAGGGGGADESQGRSQASIQVSFCEIYNEQVRDLFCQAASGHGLRVREHPTRGAFVEGLSARPVTCYQQVQHLLEVGMSARATAATSMNEVSSRSHAIFTIYVTVTVSTKLSHGRAGGGGTGAGEAEDDVSSRTSKICLVDLAGSERANSTGAKGERLREASNINKSLSTLSDVIKALARRLDSGRGSTGGANESFIPYRNSMLTWLLKDSIGGNSKTVMLAAISPVADAYQETMSTLRYVERAKDIVNSISVNDTHTNPLMAKLKEEIRGLQELLEKRDSAIVQHEEKEAVLTAALERARADDGDKASEALAAADSLQAALLVEKREHALATASAAELAASTERRHKRELDRLNESHAAAVEDVRVSFDEEVKTLQQEATEILSEELAREKEHAAEEKCRLRREWEEAAKFERDRLRDAHREEMCRTKEQSKCETDRVSIEAASELEQNMQAAATAAAAAAGEMLELQNKHASEITEKEQGAEQRLLGELRVLRETLEAEKVVAEENARCIAEAQRAGEIEVAVKNAETVAEAANVTALDALHKQHDAAFVQLSEAHSVAVKAAVEEAGKRLGSEHRAAIQAAVAARDASLQEAHRKHEKRLAEEHAAHVEATVVALRAGLNDEHEEELARLRQENDNRVAGVRDAADVRRTADLAKAAEDAKSAVTAAENESARSVDALKQCHHEELRTVHEDHEAEIRRTTEAEKLRSEASSAEIATKCAVELKESQGGAARALEASERDWEENLRILREEHEAESQRDIATADRNLTLALDGVAQGHEVVLAEAEAETTARVTALLERKHEEHMMEAEGRWKVDAEHARREAEERRKLDIATAGEAFSASAAELKADAAVALAKEKDKHHQELRRAEEDGNVELEQVRAAADEKLVIEHAVAAETLVRSMKEAQVEHAAANTALESRHREEISKSTRHYEAEIGRINARVTLEREQWESDLTQAKGDSLSSLATATAEKKAELDTQGAQHRDELQRVGEEYNTQLERENLAAEKRRRHDLAAVRDEGTSCLAEAKQRTAESIAALQSEHHAALESLHREGKVEQERIAEAASATRNAEVVAVHEKMVREIEACETKAAAASAATETRHQEELTKALKDCERRIREHSVACEEANAVENTRMVASLEKVKAAHRGEALRLSEEHAAEKASASVRAEKQRADELAAAQSQFNAFKAELVEERATFVARNLRELRAAKQEATTEIERVTMEAAKKKEALEEERSKILTDLKASHLEELEKKRVEGDADREAAVAAASANATAAVEELRRTELTNLKEKLTASAAETHKTASETHAKALAEALAEAIAESKTKLAAALAAQEMKFTEARKGESDTHAKALASAEASRLSAEQAADTRFESLNYELSGRIEAGQAAALEKVERAAAAVRDREAEHEVSIEALEKAHRAAFAELEESQQKECEMLVKRAETAETATAEVQASADELGTRAAALDEMLRASVGSKEEELAGHRSRVAQLQAFVARHEATSSSADTNGDAATRGGQRLTTTAARSVHQRLVDLRAMAGKGVACAGAGGGRDCFGLAAFASTGLVGGLTMEKYTEELEVVLVRTTVEAAAARQDHLEADMLLQSVTRQHVGLKLVHAQLRECLEDTQVKLEHKSQSAARRLINSAARLAYEFAKPDRLPHGAEGAAESPKMFSRTTPRAMSSQTFGKRSPLSRTMGGARRKSPARERGSTSSLDLNTTL